MIETVTAIAYLFRDLASIAAMLLFVRHVFLKNYSFSLPKVILLSAALLFNALFGAFFLMGRTEDYRAIMDFASNVIEIAAILLLTKERRFFRALLFVFVFSFTVDMLYSFVSPYISQELYVEALINAAVYSVIILIIVLSLRRSSVNILPQVFDEIPKWLFVVLLLFELTCYYREFGVSADWYNALYIISSIGIFAVVLFLVVKIFSLSYRQSLILKQMEVQKDFGERTILGDEELRRFRHDYRNHMIVVNAYLQSGRIDEAKSYLSTVNAQVRPYLSNIVSGNFVADAILNHKAVLAAESGIGLSFDGAIPGDGIGENDLCTVLSNLIDNAIEGCKALSAEREKTIGIKGTVSNRLFLLHVENPTILEALPKKTTKRDGRNHGFGIRNVRRVAELYDGTVNLSVENGVYSADVYLTLKEEN